jgi:HlyD family secretion protein
MKTGTKIKLAAATNIFLIVLFTAGSCHRKATTYTFETDVAKTGSVRNTVTATGTVQADTTVSVGTQVSGVINKVYVDFNSVVKKGQLLAELDKTPLQTQVSQAQAALDDSKSEVQFQTATFERNKSLFEKNLIAKADFDQAKYNYDKAMAALKTAQAGYDKAIVNLNYASITAPISGVILNRAIDQGQTVAASFNTPTLFTIGNDLNHVQVQANVDEADIGMVRSGQPVEFTVDAFPAATFDGEVRQVRLQPVVTNNVVTYTVIVNAPNPEKKLMPGMTANITVLVQEADSVLVIPGRALRFNPDPSYLAEQRKRTKDTLNSAQSAQPGREKGRGGEFTGQGMRNAGLFGKSQGKMKKQDAVWVKNGDTLRRVVIQTGLSDGTNTQIISGLHEGDQVVLSMSAVGKKSNQADGSQTRSPFMPQRRSQTTTPTTRPAR